MLEVAVIHLHPAITSASMELMRRHGPVGLRILDSIQLACCLAVTGATMLVADGPLAEFAGREGVAVRRVGDTA